MLDDKLIKSYLNETNVIYINPRMACPQALTSSTPYSAFHQPHFSEHFFLFISLVLWQQELFGSESCIRYFGVSSDIAEFWHDHFVQKPTWVMQLIDTMNAPFGDFVISNEFARAHGIQLIDDNREKLLRWFLHPSDAIWLTANILGLDPCARGKDASPMVAAVLQRFGSREILNIDDVKQAVHRRFQGDVAEVSFEGKHLKEQVAAMHATDVLVAVHGAGETNVAFMKPCSVVLEICPFGYCEFGVTHGATTYFGTLADNAGLVYYRYTEQKRNCVLKDDAYTGGGTLTGNRKKCSDIYGALPLDGGVASVICQPNKYCRACSRLTNLIVNTSSLLDILDQALVGREKCLASHSYYKNF